MMSNCLFKALQYKFKDPFNIKIYKRGSWFEIFTGHWPHFYWYDKRCDCYFHFHMYSPDLSFIHQLWFRGYVTEFYYYKRV